MEKATGLDIKSLLAGYLGGKLIEAGKKTEVQPVILEKTVVEKKVPAATTTTAAKK